MFWYEIIIIITFVLMWLYIQIIESCPASKDVT
jgi:hypothetical protein